MKIELLVSRVGPAGAQNRGEVIDVEAAEGGRMIEAGQAVAVRGKAKPETAVAQPRGIEKASK